MNSRISPAAVVLTVLVLIGFASCHSPQHIYVADVNPRGWSAAGPVSVVYPNTDTTARRTVSVLFRHGSDYRYDRLTCLLTTTSPEGYKWQDTVSMRSFAGERTLGIYYDMEQPYRTEVVFPSKGAYLFTFSPMMPEAVTQEVASVGVAIY